MSDNGDALAIIREEAGDEAYKRICARLCGDRVWFPHWRNGLIRDKIARYVASGYTNAQIASHLRCSVRWVRTVRKRLAKRVPSVRATVARRDNQGPAGPTLPVTGTGDTR